MRTGSRQLDAAIQIYRLEGFDALGKFIKEVLERRPSGWNPRLYEVMCKKVIRMVGEMQDGHST